MTDVVFLNGSYMPSADARISPMDRGFLFGDGIYEVIPTHHGKAVGLDLHLQRMNNGLAEIGVQYDARELNAVCGRLLQENAGEHLNVYLHVSRGQDAKRFHGVSPSTQPTVFAYTWQISEAKVADKSLVQPLSVITAEDLRWKRCHIKSTSLLGNVLHFQNGHGQGYDETLLFNAADELTEGSASNVFVVTDGIVKTPPLDEQLLPGITRHLVLDILRRHSTLPVEETRLTRAEVMRADEIWMTSASKEIAPVTRVDDQAVGTGEVGDVWLQAQALYSQHCYDY